MALAQAVKLNPLPPLSKHLDAPPILFSTEMHEGRLLSEERP